jgi:DNA polymerase-3 subunit gamma/tau
MCRAFSEGRALDLVEIDGASNRGIDEIRELRERINFAPNIARYKVYIIDEVHMLTEPAFNALLKTLEEPPPHAKFVLATTEVHKVPLTILSRCQRFDFRRLPQAAVVKKLKEISDHEGINIESQALALIAKAATGSLRDAENLLEQLVLYHGSNIILEQVREELGISDDSRIRKLAECIFKKDIAGGLAVINSVAVDGVDLRQFNRGLVDHLRALLLVKTGAEDTTDLLPDTIKEMKHLLANISLGELSGVVKLFAQVDFRVDPQSTLPLELALVDFSLSTGEKLKKAVPEKKADVEPATGTIHFHKKVEIIKEPGAIVPPVTCELPATKVAEVAKQQRTAAQPVSAELPPTKIDEAAKQLPPQNIEQIRQRWSDFINACRGVGSSGNLDALLRRACEALALEGDTLVLGFYWEFQRSKIEDPKYRHLVEDKLRDVFGVSYHVRCVLTPKDKDKESKQPQRPRNPVVNAALEMGAMIVEEEHKDDE